VTLEQPFPTAALQESGRKRWSRQNPRRMRKRETTGPGREGGKSQRRVVKRILTLYLSGKGEWEKRLGQREKWGGSEH